MNTVERRAIVKELVKEREQEEEAVQMQNATRLQRFVDSFWIWVLVLVCLSLFIMLPIVEFAAYMVILGVIFYISRSLRKNE